MTNAWAGSGNPAATGVAGRAGLLRFRHAFLGTVAAGALSLAGSPALANDPCVLSAGNTIETCTGNQSGGVANPGGVVTTLNVNNLNQAIAPASGTNGITFTSAGAVTVNSDTGTFGITTANAVGISAVSTAAAVTVTSSGNITATGANTAGILAKTQTTGAVAVTSTGNIMANLGIYAVSAGGAAAVTSTGNITTGSVGILVGGGNGDLTVTSTGNITTTATGNVSALGILANHFGTGTLTVNSTGNITTVGALGSYAIIAASTGPGAITLTSAGNLTTTGDHSYGISFRGNGVATVTSIGNVATSGTGSTAINVLSDNAATLTSTGNITTKGFRADGTSVYSGGTGAATVTSTGNITTTGDSSPGIFADARGTGAIAVSSIGNITTTGGGGSIGIYAYGHGGSVTVTSKGNISTTGSNGTGIFAISDGAITVTSTGDITTAGVDARGISAQSLVGGGVTVTSTGHITTAGQGAYGIFAYSGGSGAATVTSTGDITTAGAIAIFAHSTDNGAVTVTSTGNITTGGQFSDGIRASSSGAVTVTSTGNITTPGKYSNGIRVLSGSAGATVTSTGNITSAAGGIIAEGSTFVTVNSKGNISGYGPGILAFSLGAGAITVTSAGNITAAGANTYGIYARSTGAPLAVTITSGTVSGGSGTGAGVDLAGGSTNTLTNMGTVTALSGLAIKASTGNNTVNNSGTVIGNVILGTGANAFNNMAGGFFNPGTTVNLGAGNLLTNAGTLSPGGAGAIQATALTGNLTQTATGTLLTDINIAGATSDRVNVSGKANLAGAVQVEVVNPTLAPFQQTVLSAAGGTTNNGLTLLASPALQAQLVFPNATDVVVKSAGVNFVTPGLNGNQIALGNALNGALGGPVINFLLNGVTSASSFGAALTQLSGEAATGTQQTTFDAMNSFMGTMLDPFNRGPGLASGPSVSGYASEGASAYASDGRKRTGAERDAYAMVTKAPPQTFEARWSVWAAGFGGSQTTDGNVVTGSNSVTSRIAGGAVGADYLLSPNTIAGFALAGGGTSFSLANGLGTGRSDLFQAGVYARHTFGAAYISGALAYGWQDITTDRTLTLAGIDHLQARFNANAFSGRVEGGYRFVSPWMGVGITPYAAGQFTTFDLPAYAEQALVGSNAFALAFGAKSVTDPRSELGLRTDKSFAMQDGVVTLRGRVAWAHDYDPSRSIGATFQTLPGASFVVNGAAQASDSALVTASIEKRWLNGWSAAATFEGEFSNVTTSYAGKGTVRYTW